VLCGVGYHHAGMDVDDRKLVERMFSQGLLAVLSQFSLPAVLADCAAGFISVPLYYCIEFVLDCVILCAFK